MVLLGFSLCLLPMKRTSIYSAARFVPRNEINRAYDKLTIIYLFQSTFRGIFYLQPTWLQCHSGDFYSAISGSPESTCQAHESRNLLLIGSLKSTPPKQSIN